MSLTRVHWCKSQNSKLILNQYAGLSYIWTFKFTRALRHGRQQSGFIVLTLPLWLCLNPWWRWEWPAPWMATNQFNLSSFFQGIPGNDGIPGNPGIPGKIVSKCRTRRRGVSNLLIQHVGPYVWIMQIHFFFLALYDVQSKTGMDNLNDGKHNIKRLINETVILQKFIYTCVSIQHKEQWRKVFHAQRYDTVVYLFTEFTDKMFEP